jgi:transcriptional regulator with XRE-family HTH domain
MTGEHVSESLETGTDSIEQFSADLRGLRAEAGNPTLEALARKTGVSKSVLSEAFSGKRLPSERTVTALTHVFDVDAGLWAARRAALDPAPRDGRVTGRASGKRFGLATVLLVAAAGLVVGAGAGIVGTNGVDDHAMAQTMARASAIANAPQIVVTTGEDPANTKCVNDAKVVSSETRSHDTLLQIIYSAACHAAWSRVTRYDGDTSGNTVSTSIYRQVDPNGSDRQSTTEPAQSAYTTLIVRPSPQTELCAVGSITVSGQTISLGAPLCM